MLASKASALASRATHRLQSVASHIAQSHSSASNFGRLQASNTALFVCDIQEKFRNIISGMPAVIGDALSGQSSAQEDQLALMFLSIRPKIEGLAQLGFLAIATETSTCVVLVDTAGRLIRGAKALDIPVVVTEQYPERLGSTVSELQQVLPPDALIQSKLEFSMLVDQVKEHLQKSSRRQVLLLGIETHVCVFQTALDLLEAGYEVHLVVDGVSSQRPSHRAVAIERIKQMGGLLVTSDMALFQLCGSSKHPAFKSISALAKEDRPAELPVASNL